MLNSRERLRRCYFHETIDRPGIFCRTGYPKNDPSYQPLDELLKQKTDLKVSFRAASLVEQPQIDRRIEACADGFDREFITMHTPEGDLIATHRVGVEGRPGMTEKHYLCDAADARKFLSLPIPEIDSRLEAFFDSDRQIGDRGIIDVSVGMNPAGQVADLFGSETFALMTVTDRDLVHALCDRQMRIMLALVDMLLDRNVGPFFSILGQEYVTPPLHSPRDFFDFNVKYDKPILDRVHERGGRVHVHCHGSIATVFDGFIEMGADVLHPFEAPPMGDITPAQAKAKARGHICLEGNVQIADMYEKSPDEIRQQVEHLITTCFDDQRGLIICPSASPWIGGAGDRCIEQFHALIDAVEAIAV